MESKIEEKYPKIDIGKAKNIIGETFGRLTVLYRTKNKEEDTNVQWVCQCDCGNYRVISARNLNHLKHADCGYHGGKNDSNLTGKVFGKLTVIEKVENQNSSTHKRNLWRCRCECGNICIVQTSHLKSGHTRSCGCILKKMLSREDLSGKQSNYLKILYKNEKAKSPEYICQCINCGKLLSVRRSTLANNRQISCGCVTASKGELTISSILNNLNINYTQQKIFHDCKFPDTNVYARFDFYLPDYNIIIEYDGAQHFEYKNSGWDTKEKFLKTQANDQYKDKWCKENGYKMIRIPYTAYDKLNKEYLLNLIQEEEEKIDDECGDSRGAADEGKLSEESLGENKN